MRKLALFAFTLLLSLNIAAQERVSVSIKNALIGELFNAIEEQTSYRVYSLSKYTDTLRVTISCENELPEKVIRQALEGTALTVISFGKDLHVLQDEKIVTSLPLAFKIRELRGENDDIQVNYDLSSFLLTEEKEQRLIAENKIYEIGHVSMRKSGTVALSGKVINYRTGEPIEGVSIFLNNSSTSVTSGADGSYLIRIPTGRQELSIKGYDINDTKVQLMVYADGVLELGVEESVQTLLEATVYAERVVNVRSATIGMERIKMKDAKNIPSVFGEVDVIKVVLSLPGVKSVGEMSSGFNVRGGAADQNLILFNDGTIYNPSHLFGVFSAFNPDMVNGMELYKSSIPAKYGGRISSVLDISGKDGSKEKIEGAASIGLLTSRLTIEGPIVKDKTSFIVGGRTTYSDWMLSKLPEKSGYKDGSANFYDLNASINHKFNNKNSIWVNGYYSHDKFSFNTQQRYSYTNTNASLKWRSIFSDQLTGTFIVGYDHYDYSTKDTETPLAAYRLDFAINQGFGKADFSWKLGDKHTLDFGLSSIYYYLSPGKYLPHGEESIVIPDEMQKEKALESAIYINDSWNITDKLLLSVGMRYSLFNALGPRTYNIYDSRYLPSLSTIQETVTKDGIFKTYHGPEFRVSSRYAFTEDFSVKAGVNTMRQNIHKISNTTIMSPTDTWKLSDANIEPQTGVQYALGFYKNFFENMIETSVEGYYKTMDHYLDYKGGAELTMNHHLETDILTTKGRAYGIEFMLKKTRGKLNGWVSYTYSKTELQQDDDRATDLVNGGAWYPADYDKPHDFKFIGNYKMTHRFSVSLNCEYSTGRPITLPVSKYIYSDGEHVLYSDRNAYRIPDYFRLDAAFNIEAGHRLTKLTHSSFSFGVYNVTGRKNAYSVYYISENGRLKGYKLSIFGAPIPYVAYNIKF